MEEGRGVLFFEANMRLILTTWNQFKLSWINIILSLAQPFRIKDIMLGSVDKKNKLFKF